MTLFPNKASGRMAVPHLEIEDISTLFSLVFYYGGGALCKKQLSF